MVRVIYLYIDMRSWLTEADERLELVPECWSNSPHNVERGEGAPNHPLFIKDRFIWVGIMFNILILVVPFGCNTRNRACSQQTHVAQP